MGHFQRMGCIDRIESFQYVKRMGLKISKNTSYPEEMGYTTYIRKKSVLHECRQLIKNLLISAPLIHKSWSKQCSFRVIDKPSNGIENDFP